MTLRLNGAGAFPKPWMARVVWTGIGGEVEAWRSLASYRQEPHLTLARTRQRLDLTGLVDELASYDGPEWVASEIVLIQSHLRGGHDRGPRYEPIDVFPLGPSGGLRQSPDER